MCIVSTHLKLCSCKTKEVQLLKHYWILKRPNGENKLIVGLAILPYNIGENVDKINKKILAKMLNRETCFDIKLHHQENDILELHFTFDASNDPSVTLSGLGNYLAYAFVFKKNKWENTDFDPYSANLGKVQQGKIMHPFLKKNN